MLAYIHIRIFSLDLHPLGHGSMSSRQVSLHSNLDVETHTQSPQLAAVTEFACSCSVVLDFSRLAAAVSSLVIVDHLVGRCSPV